MQTNKINLLETYLSLYISPMQVLNATKKKVILTMLF